MFKTGAILFLTALVCLGQGPAGVGRGRGPMGGANWWENPLIGNLNLSDAQRKQIQTTTREFRNRLVDARAAAEKAEGELQDAFNDATVEERRVNDLIDRGVKARGELMKQVTLMSWKLRGILTAEQWQELQRRRPAFGGPLGGPQGGPGGIPGEPRRNRGKNDARQGGGPPPAGNPPGGQPPRPGGQL